VLTHQTFFPLFFFFAMEHNLASGALFPSKWTCAAAVDANLVEELIEAQRRLEQEKAELKRNHDAVVVAHQGCAARLHTLELLIDQKNSADRHADSQKVHGIEYPKCEKARLEKEMAAQAATIEDLGRQVENLKDDLGLAYNDNLNLKQQHAEATAKALDGASKQEQRITQLKGDREAIIQGCIREVEVLRAKHDEALKKIASDKLEAEAKISRLENIIKEMEETYGKQHAGCKTHNEKQEDLLRSADAKLVSVTKELKDLQLKHKELISIHTSKHVNCSRIRRELETSCKDAEGKLQHSEKMLRDSTQQYSAACLNLQRMTTELNDARAKITQLKEETPDSLKEALSKALVQLERDRARIRELEAAKTTTTPVESPSHDEVVYVWSQRCDDILPDLLFGRNTTNVGERVAKQQQQQRFVVPPGQEEFVPPLKPPTKAAEPKPPAKQEQPVAQKKSACEKQHAFEIFSAGAIYCRQCGEFRRP
jgi:DNA repair exonuclease SbcCD ATPase subunit